MFDILARKEIAPNVHEVVIAAPAIARKARPGQFVVVMVDERAERVPYTLCDWDAEAGTVVLVVQEVGRSSHKLVVLDAGDRIAHIVGPLGVPVEIDRYGTVALAGGCYGIGAIVRIAQAMRDAGNRVLSIVEARSHYLHYWLGKLAAASDELVEVTIDGSHGFRGHTVDALEARLKAGERIDRVIAVGCPFMMMLAGQATRPFGVKTLVALNPIMLDGTGMCGACRVTVGERMRFACVDGPFFDAHEVDWDELWHRKAAYSAEEIRSVAGTGRVRGGGR